MTYNSLIFRPQRRSFKQEVLHRVSEFAELLKFNLTRYSKAEKLKNITHPTMNSYSSVTIFIPHVYMVIQRK